MKAIIIGAGIGGLAAAAALERVGIQTVVYERAPALSRVGAGLTLWHNGLYALSLLGLSNAALQAGMRLESFEIRERGGRVLARSTPEKIDQKMGVPVIGIHRADLHAVLLAALPGGCVQLGKTFEALEQDPDGVTVHFSDGTSDRGDLLVGADGIHSQVRALLFGTVKGHYAGYTSWRGLASLGPDEMAALPPGLAVEIWGNGVRFGCLRVNPGDIYWFATQNGPVGRYVETPLDQTGLLERFRGWHAPVEELIQRTSNGAILHNDLFDLPPLPAWSRGRAALLGDAAHATTPNMGQGACQALESALVLADSLASGAAIETALSDYEARRKPRTAWVTEQSRRIGRIAQIDSPVLGAVRNAFFRMAGEWSAAVLTQVAMYRVPVKDERLVEKSGNHEVDMNKVHHKR